jgi:hypothetical protein
MDVVIGVDAHKRTHTLVAVDPRGRKLAEKTVATTSAAHAEAVRWARGRFGNNLVWGVEDCRSLTTRLGVRADKGSHGAALITLKRRIVRSVYTRLRADRVTDSQA